MIFWINFPIHTETPTQVEQNDTTIHKIQHLLLKIDQEEVQKLQEKDSYYAELIESMKLEIREVKENTLLIPMEHYKK